MRWQIVQEQVAIPQEKGGASFHLLTGDLNWLQIGFSLTEASLALGVRLSPLNVTRDFVVKQESGTQEGGRGTLALTSFVPNLLDRWLWQNDL